MADEKDPPIVPPGFIGGINVVDIGDLRIARGLSRRPHSACKHKALVYDQSERRIWCKDCERDVEHFDAFINLVQNFGTAWAGLERRSKELAEAETFQLRSLAAKELDKAWRKRAMVPACPQCGGGLFPEDFKNGIRGSLGREYAEALRRKWQEKKT